MGIVFEMRVRRKRVVGEGSINGDANGHADEANGNINEEEDHERTALLANER